MSCSYLLHVHIFNVELYDDANLKERLIKWNINRAQHRYNPPGIDLINDLQSLDFIRWLRLRDDKIHILENTYIYIQQIFNITTEDEAKRCYNFLCNLAEQEILLRQYERYYNNMISIMVLFVLFLLGVAGIAALLTVPSFTFLNASVFIFAAILSITGSLGGFLLILLISPYISFNPIIKSASEYEKDRSRLKSARFLEELPTSIICPQEIELTTVHIPSSDQVSSTTTGP